MVPGTFLGKKIRISKLKNKLNVLKLQEKTLRRKKTPLVFVKELHHFTLQGWINLIIPPQFVLQFAICKKEMLRKIRKTQHISLSFTPPPLHLQLLFLLNGEHQALEHQGLDSSLPMVPELPM